MSSSSPSPPALPPFLDRASSGTEELPAPRRGPWKVIGAILVVGIFIIGLIFIAGVVPRPGGTAGPPTFSGAQQTANSAANSYGSGGWVGIAADAVAISAPASLSASEIETVFAANNCSVTWAPSAPTVIHLPVTSAGTPTGAADSWFFVYSDRVRVLLLVLVTNESGQPLFTATGGNCSFAAQFGTPLSQSAIVDSPVAVSAADSKGGSTFLADHPRANRTWTVVGGLAPTWLVAYSICPLPPPANTTVTDPLFNATVDAQTGVAITGGVTTTVCSLSLPFTFPFILPVPAGSSHPAGPAYLLRTVPVEEIP